MGSGGEYAEVTLGVAGTSASKSSDARDPLVPPGSTCGRQPALDAAGPDAVAVSSGPTLDVGEVRATYLDGALAELASARTLQIHAGDRRWCSAVGRATRCPGGLLYRRHHALRPQTRCDGRDALAQRG